MAQPQLRPGAKQSIDFIKEAIDRGVASVKNIDPSDPAEYDKAILETLNAFYEIRIRVTDEIYPMLLRATGPEVVEPTMNMRMTELEEARRQQAGEIAQLRKELAQARRDIDGYLQIYAQNT